MLWENAACAGNVTLLSSQSVTPRIHHVYYVRLPTSTIHNAASISIKVVFHKVANTVARNINPGISITDSVI